MRQSVTVCIFCYDRPRLARVFARGKALHCLYWRLQETPNIFNYILPTTTTCQTDLIKVRLHCVAQSCKFVCIWLIFSRWCRRKMIRDCQKIERVDVSRVARSLSWPSALWANRRVWHLLLVPCYLVVMKDIILNIGQVSL